MNENERKLISKLIINEITEQQFLSEFTVNVVQHPSCVFELLERAYNEENADDIEQLIGIAGRFNLFTESNAELLCNLLEARWHYRHEDIARALQSIKSPNSIECLYKTALTKFEYLEHDNSYALARKCMWALGDINTDESKKKIELLAESEDEELREYAFEQLNRKR